MVGASTSSDLALVLLRGRPTAPGTRCRAWVRRLSSASWLLRAVERPPGMWFAGEALSRDHRAVARRAVRACDASPRSGVATAGLLMVLLVLSSSRSRRRVRGEVPSRARCWRVRASSRSAAWRRSRRRRVGRLHLHRRARLPRPRRAGHVPAAAAIHRDAASVWRSSRRAQRRVPGRPSTSATPRARRISAQERFAALGRIASGVGHEINNPLQYLSLNLEELREQRLVATSAEAQEALAQIVRAPPSASVASSMGCARTRARPSRSWRPSTRGNSCRRRSRRPLPEFEPVSGDRSNGSMPVPHVLGDRGEPRAGDRECGGERGDGARASRARARRACELRTYTAPGGEAAIEVRDNGPGFPTDMLPRLGEPFVTTRVTDRGQRARALRRARDRRRARRARCSSRTPGAAVRSSGSCCRPRPRAARLRHDGRRLDLHQRRPARSGPRPRPPTSRGSGGPITSRYAAPSGLAAGEVRGAVGDEPGEAHEVLRRSRRPPPGRRRCSRSA